MFDLADVLPEAHILAKLTLILAATKDFIKMSELLLVSNLSMQVSKTEITVNSVLQDDMTWE